MTTKGPLPPIPYSLSKLPGCPCCSILQVGKLRLGGVQGLSPPGHTAGIGWRQDLNPGLSDSKAESVFKFSFLKNTLNL